MTDTPSHPEPLDPQTPRYTGVRAFVKLARPTQWSKSVFVMIGPAYGWAQGERFEWWGVLWAAIAFSLASSGLYVINDWFDREKDRVHPRKRHRPLASGSVSARAGLIYAVCLLLASVAAVLMLPTTHTKIIVGVLVGLHMINVLSYSAYLKRKVIVDVLSLSMGFVLRVMAGCAAVEIEASSWLLNATLFLSMFLAFGKRLGERRTLGEQASAARSVQQGYSDVLLEMAVVVTAVATLLTYAGYVQSRAADFTVRFGEVVGEGVGPGFGFNLLWITMLPSTLAVLRTMVQLDRGKYDDPTELAMRDAVVRVCAVAFAGLTFLAVVFEPGRVQPILP
ncbi:MAG: UbiA prenyltransferase family protein [Planctomycetota bacterium]